MRQDECDTKHDIPDSKLGCDLTFIEHRLQRQIGAVLTRLTRDYAVEIRDEHDILESIYTRYKAAACLLAKGRGLTGQSLCIDGWATHYANHVYREPNTCLLIELRAVERLVMEYRSLTSGSFNDKT